MRDEVSASTRCSARLRAAPARRWHAPAYPPVQFVGDLYGAWSSEILESIRIYTPSRRAPSSSSAMCRYAGHRRRPRSRRRCPRVPDVRLRSLDRRCPGPKSVSPSTPDCRLVGVRIPLTPTFPTSRVGYQLRRKSARKLPRRVWICEPDQPANCSLRRTAQRPPARASRPRSTGRRGSPCPPAWPRAASPALSRLGVSHLREGGRGTSQPVEFPPRRGSRRSHRATRNPDEQRGGTHRRSPPAAQASATRQGIICARLTTHRGSPTVRRPAPTQCAIPTFLAGRGRTKRIHVDVSTQRRVEHGERAEDPAGEVRATSKAVRAGDVSRHRRPPRCRLGQSAGMQKRCDRRYPAEPSTAVM